MIRDQIHAFLGIWIFGIIIGLVISLAADAKRSSAEEDPLTHRREAMFLRCMDKIVEKTTLLTVDQRIEITDSCKNASLTFYPDKLK